MGIIILDFSDIELTLHSWGKKPLIYDKIVSSLYTIQLSISASMFMKTIDSNVLRYCLYQI